MDADPLRDLDAAVAYTDAHAFQHNRFSVGRRKVINYGPDSSPRRGKPQCAWRTFANYDYHQCGSVGRVTLADGSTWCGVHAPAAVAARKAKVYARDAARVAKWDAQRAVFDERQRRLDAYSALVDALQAIARGHNDPRTLALETLALSAPESLSPDDH